MLNDHKIKISNYQTKFDKSHPPLPPLLPPPLPLLWPLKSLGDHSLREVRPGSGASDLCFCQMLGNPDRFSVPKTQRAQQSPAVEDPEIQESPWRNLLPTDIQEAFIKQFSCFQFYFLLIMGMCARTHACRDQKKALVSSNWSYRGLLNCQIWMLGP